MKHKFESKADKDRKVTIELVREFKHSRTIVKYPVPDPRDRVDDEYDEDSQFE